MITLLVLTFLIILDAHWKTNVPAVIFFTGAVVGLFFEMVLYIALSDQKRR